MGSSKTFVIAALLAAMLVASGAAASATGRPHSTTGPTLADCRKVAKSEVVAKGKLTVATNNPALAPWFVNDNPGNGKGYESAVAYHLGSILGFKTSTVAWYTEPFELAVTSGAKPFDFDINEITYAKSLTNSVSVSLSYFNVNQSLVALKSARIVTRHTPRELRTYIYGAIAKSPGLKYLESKVKPKTAPVTYPTISDAVSALMAKRIQAIIIDTPTGQYLTTQQLSGAVQFAQLHTTGQEYVLALQKGNPLVACVNTAIKVLRRDGQLNELSKKYLKVYNDIPFIAP